jgi:hypothetical protein
VARKNRKKSGSGLDTAVNVAAAAIDVVSLIYEAMQQMQQQQHRRQPMSWHGDGERDPGGEAAAKARAPDEDQDISIQRRRAGQHPVGRAVDMAGAMIDTARVVLDLNRTRPAKLRSLPRVGRKRARKIVAHRPFKRVKDLKQVLPKRVYKAIKNKLTV